MEKQKTAVITGIKGQAASYLSELLLNKGYKVIGIEKRCSSPDYTNILHLIDNTNFFIEQGDITDFGSIARIVEQYKPEEFYNLAAQSNVGASWTQPIATCEIDFMGVVNCLESIRLFSPKTKFLQSSTSERYGDVQIPVQNEETPTRARSPYAAAKIGAESLVKVYKDSYNIFSCFSICYNFESKFRAREFVTRKITDWIGKAFNKVEHFVLNNVQNGDTVTVEEGFKRAIENGIINKLKLGNIDSKRDWQSAKDIVRGMWLMLQQETPDNFVFASGETRSVREFLTEAFNQIGVSNWESFIEIDPKLYRPAEVNLLCGDSTKALNALGWKNEISFKELVKEMVQNDILINERMV